jgi:transposase
MEGSTPLTALTAENQQLRQDLELLRAQHAELLSQRQQQEHVIADLQQRLQYLLRRLFGRSAEKLDPNQLQLFTTLLDHLAPRQLAPDESPEQPAPQPEAASADGAAKPAKKGHGRRRLPADLPRQKVFHDLAEAEKPCPCCGQMRHVIGQEVSEQLDYVPAKLTVIEHIRLKYACPACEQQAAPDGPQIRTAEKPLAPVEKGLAAPGLLAYVIVSKYGDHLPLHRLEHILERHGVEIARSTMCDWTAQSATAGSPVYDVMTHEVRLSRIILTDDTPVDVLDRDGRRTRIGRFWVYIGDAEHPFTVFVYTPNRKRDGPLEFLKGWGKDRPVFLQADAFGGYDGIYAGEAGGQVTEVACWAHARRKFYEARNTDIQVSTRALAYIRLLYDVEDQAKAEFKQLAQAQPGSQGDMPRATSDPASADAAGARPSLAAIRLALRQELAAPRLAEFRAWLQSQQAQNGGPVLPKSPLGEAITYAFNQWEALTVYTTDGELAIDNNASENALRRVALGRKNWLFCGSDKGGHTAAVLFSLIATCQRHKVEPFGYLRDVLTRIAAHPVSRLAELLPTAYRPNP